MNSIKRIRIYKYINRLSVPSNFKINDNSSLNNSNDKYNKINTYYINNNINNNNNNYINSNYINSNNNSNSNNNNNLYFKRHYSSSSLDSYSQQEKDIKYNFVIIDAIEQFKNKEIKKSIDTFIKALNVCSDRPDAYLLRADIKSEFCRLYQSTAFKYGILQDYKLAVERESDDIKKAYILYSISKYLSKLSGPAKDLKQSISFLDKALELDPNNILYLKDKVLLASNLKDIDISETSEKLVKQDRDKYGKLSLAIISLIKGDKDKAIQIIKSIIQDNKDINRVPLVDKDQDSTVYYNRLIIKEDSKGGLRVREKYFFQSNDILFDSYLVLGHIYFQQGDYTLCCESYLKALELKPWAYQLHSIMGSLALSLGKYKETIQHCNNFFLYDQDYESPYSKQALMDRGVANYHLSNTMEAMDDLIISLERSWFFDKSKEIIDYRANASVVLIQCLDNFIQLCPGLDSTTASGINELIRNTDGTNQILSQEPMNIHELYQHSLTLFNIYNNISNWIDNRPQDFNVQERNIITSRTLFFYHMSEYLADSLYTNYRNGSYTEYYDADRPRHYKSFDDFLYQLPNYQESYQPQSRQEAHKLLLNLYKNLITLINKNDK